MSALEHVQVEETFAEFEYVAHGFNSGQRCCGDKSPWILDLVFL